VAHGARILQIDGNFDDCLELARKTTADYPVAALVNSVNPMRIAGQASAAYEVCDELGRAPDVHCLPVGNAGNITAWIGAPASWAGAMTAREESNGRFAAVTDDEILAAYRLLSAREGVFVEPASAASVAGLLQSCEDGTLPRGSLVVCTVTGHGLKDPDTALLTAPEPTVVPIDAGAVAAALELR
jgi:threonine synthase